jgi:hypothetical protein
VDVICGGLVSIGVFLSWFGMSKALNALLSICADSSNLGVIGCSGDGNRFFGSEAAASKSSHSLGHGSSGSLAICWRWISCIENVWYNSMSFLRCPIYR